MQVLPHSQAIPALWAHLPWGWKSQPYYLLAWEGFDLLVEIATAYFFHAWSSDTLLGNIHILFLTQKGRLA